MNERRTIQRMRDVTEQLVTEGDDKEEISFENEQHVGQMGGEAG